MSWKSSTDVFEKNICGYLGYITTDERNLHRWVVNHPQMFFENSSVDVLVRSPQMKGTSTDELKKICGRVGYPQMCGGFICGCLRHPRMFAEDLHRCSFSIAYFPYKEYISCSEKMGINYPLGTLKYEIIIWFLQWK